MVEHVPLAAYDQELSADLARLSSQQRAAFAAACAERLYPAYLAFRAASASSDDDPVRQALDLAWYGAVHGQVCGNPASLVEASRALIPDADDESSLPPHADDAICAAAYALQCAAGLDDQAAHWAAQRGTDALDSFLLDSGEAQDDQGVWAHPLVLAELRRRREDLVTLAGPDLGVAVGVVRDRAVGASLLPLDGLRHWLER